MPVHIIADTADKILALRSALEQQYAVTSELLSGTPNRGNGHEAVVVTADLRVVENIAALKETFAKANLPAEIEVYTGSAHGWCPPDSGVYNEQLAEKAWSRLLALYGKALA